MAKKTGKRATSLDAIIGNNVRVWRLAGGLSQSDLAEWLGITFQQVQKYEVGTNRIGTGRLVKIAAVLRVPVRALMEGTDEGAPILLTALVSDSRSFRLASAFATIPDDYEKLRLSLVVLVERIAAQASRRPLRLPGKRKKVAIG